MNIKSFLFALIFIASQPLWGLSPQTAALFTAVKQGDMQAVYDRLAADANIFAQDEQGNTPLVYAVTVNIHPEIIAPLINAGAKLVYINEKGKNIDILTLAIDQAVKDNRYLVILKALLVAAYFTITINTIDLQLNRLTKELIALNNQDQFKNAINNMKNAMAVLADHKKELEKGVRIQAEMAAELNW